MSRTPFPSLTESPIALVVVVVVIKHPKPCNLLITYKNYGSENVIVISTEGMVSFLVIYLYKDGQSSDFSCDTGIVYRYNEISLHLPLALPIKSCFNFLTHPVHSFIEWNTTKYGGLQAECIIVHQKKSLKWPVTFPMSHLIVFNPIVYYPCYSKAGISPHPPFAKKGGIHPHIN